MVHKIRVLLAWSQFLQVPHFLSLLWKWYKIFYSFYKLWRGSDLDCFLPKARCLIHLPVINNLLLLKGWILSVLGRTWGQQMLICCKYGAVRNKNFCIQEIHGHHKLLGFWTDQHLSVFYSSTMMLHRSYSWMLCVPTLSHTITHSLAELSYGALQSFPGLTEYIMADLA